MGWVDWFWHVAGFLAPALFVAGCLPLAARLVYGKAARARSFGRQFAVNLAVGVVALAAGLAWSGRDGRMLTYAALALACAAAQTWQMRR